MQAKIDQLEEQGVVAKANEIGIIPKFASPTLLVQKNSVRDLGKDQYKLLPISERMPLSIRPCRFYTELLVVLKK